MKNPFHEREPKALDRVFVRRVLFVVAALALTYLAWRLVGVFLLAFGAVIVAVLLRSLADPINDRTPLNSPLSLLAAGLIIVAVLAASGWLFGSTVSAQVGQLADSLPQSVAELQKRVATVPFGPELLERMQAGGGGMASRLGGLFSQSAPMPCRSPAPGPSCCW